MHAGGTCKLCDTTDGVLDLLARNHHEVGELIDDDDDLRQLLRLLILRNLRIIPHGHDLLVVALEITGAALGELLIAIRHLGDRPVQRGGCLLRIGYDRNQQVRDAVVDGELHDLRIDHDHADILRLILEEEGHDQGVDADRLTGAGGTRDEQMRHLRDVGDDGLARDVLTDTERELRLRPLELGTAEHIPEINGRTVLVRHLDADRRLARNRCLDTDIRRSETHLDIVCERHDLRHLHTDLRLQLIARDGRTDGDIRNRDIDAEALQRLLEGQRVLADFLSRIEVLTCRLLQEAQRRDHVWLLRLLFLDDLLLYLRVIRIRRCIFLLLAIELGFDLLFDRLDIGIDHLTV